LPEEEDASDEMSHSGDGASGSDEEWNDGDEDKEGDSDGVEA